MDWISWMHLQGVHSEPFLIPCLLVSFHVSLCVRVCVCKLLGCDRVFSTPGPLLPVGPSMWSSVTEINGSIPIHGWNAGGKLHIWPSLRQMSFSRSLLPTVYDCFMKKSFWIPCISNLHCAGLPWFPGSYRWRLRISLLWWCHFGATELCVLDTEMSSPQDLGDISE